MGKTVHEIHPDVAKLQGKARLLFCEVCGTDTLQTTPFFGYPFRCVANHSGNAKCDGCQTFVSEVAKVSVSAEGNYKRFCELCCEPDSPKKQQRLEARRQQAAEQAKKPIDLNDPTSVARALGASSFTGR